MIMHIVLTLRDEHKMIHPKIIRISKLSQEKQGKTLTAKNQYLKAIDFSFKVLNRMAKAGYAFPDASIGEIKERLVFLRKMVQEKGGIDLKSLEDNVGKIKEKSKGALDDFEKREESLIPSLRHYDAFMKEFSDSSKKAAKIQQAYLLKLVKKKTGMKNDAVIIRKCMSDAIFAEKVYDIILPELKKAQSEMKGNIPSSGKIQTRIKAFASSFKKQSRAGNSFLGFFDLVGFRIVAKDVPAMAEVADAIQSGSEITDKDNKYLDNAAYLAIHYGSLSSNNILSEVQVKTSDNLVEAAISHDILYKPEMSLISLTDQEKSMVQKVVDISIQASLEDLSQLM